MRTLATLPLLLAFGCTNINVPQDDTGTSDDTGTRDDTGDDDSGDDDSGDDDSGDDDSGDDDSGDDDTGSDDTGTAETCDDDLQNQDETGVDCGGVCDPCTNCVPAAKRLFLTSSTYKGDFTAPVSASTGLEGGDAICQLHADNAGIGGTWGAWLSDDEHDAIDRVANVGPWYLADRCTKIFDSKASITFSGPLAAFNQDEHGATVHPVDSGFWSSTDEYGHFLGGFSCSGWTNDSLTGTGPTGSSYFDWDTENWTEYVTLRCDYRRRILCIEK